MTPDDHDPRLRLYLDVLTQLSQGNCDVQIPAGPIDEIGQLGQALQELAKELANRICEQQKLDQITAHINAGLLLEDILQKVYDNFHDLIPYERIGFALIENEGRTVRAHWASSTKPTIELQGGYEAPMAGSSLESIIQTGRPRILNDLVQYLKEKPTSDSTRLIVAEGFRSSLTCPLIANGAPVGFIFFSSVKPNTYARVHIDTFQRIANQLSIILEKGRLASELRTQEAAVQKQNEQLRNLNELKDSFLGMAAHDLRNPIGYIQTVSSYLTEVLPDYPMEDVSSILSDILKQTQHMLTLIDDLLDVTRIESGKLMLRPESVDLRRFLTEAVERHGRMASAKGTQVLLEDVQPGEGIADPERLRQVMDNLISNAVKYSPPGSTVRVAASREENGWRVSVQDEGPGITERDRPRLFQDFARLSARPTGGEKSVGLGLAITRRVIEAHGGQIGADSQPGQGATFWFTLPDKT